MTDKPERDDPNRPGEESPAERPAADPTRAHGAERIESIRRDESGKLVVRLADRDEPIADARVARCFPWSVPQFYVSVRDADGKEVALVTRTEELDADSRAVVENELTDKVFNPRIERIVECKSEFGVTAITADTDRGPVTFQLRSRDDVRLLSPTRALFRDVDGNAYELPDFNALDRASQKHLAEFF